MIQLDLEMLLVLMVVQKQFEKMLVDIVLLKLMIIDTVSRLVVEREQVEQKVVVVELLLAPLHWGHK